MSSGRADKIVNTLHTASIILQHSVSTQLGNIYTKHVQSRVFTVLSKCCLILTHVIQWDLNHNWSGLASSPSTAWGEGQAVNLAWEAGIVVQHSTGWSRRQYMPLPALGVILACDLSPQVFLPLYFPYCLWWCLPMRYKMTTCCWQTLFYLQGFSITEVQKKQAMLNASKQHHTGKPKGESHLNIQMLLKLGVRGGCTFTIWE